MPSCPQIPRQLSEQHFSAGTLEIGGIPDAATTITRATLLGALERTGWQVEEIANVDTGALQDADREVAIALDEAPEGLAKTMLRQTAASKGDKPLPAYALTAR